MFFITPLYVRKKRTLGLSVFHPGGSVCRNGMLIPGVNIAGMADFPVYFKGGQYPGMGGQDDPESTFADSHIDKATVILKKQGDFQHISLRRCENIVFETFKESTGIADLIGSKFLLPFDNRDISPGFGYFTFGKFGLGALH